MRNGRRLPCGGRCAGNPNDWRRCRRNLTGYPNAPVALKVTEKQILENISYEEEEKQ
jgi:hypothetical protein